MELLRPHTSLSVEAATDGKRIEPNHVYTCVPSRDLVVSDGHLRLVDPNTERRLRRPIDRLFESVASSYGDRAIAIVLSGSASDGSSGIAAVKSEGGMVIVQDPDSAEFDGMPRSAIDTGLADVVVPVERMSEILRKLTATPDISMDHGASRVASDPQIPTTLGSILNLLRDRFNYDFSAYKQPTMLRRTQRRMSLRNMSDFAAYASLVKADEKEAASLFRDLMINVSCFFRDLPAWTKLEQLVIDPLISRLVNGDEIRVWSAGCASGEEAYSLAMLLSDRIEAAGKDIRPRIFATDVSDSLDVARAGIYSANIADELPERRLHRYFLKTESAYVVNPTLRDLIVFARHNVITDPPFSRMDLICCRNMLIYIEPEMQQKILSMFNFALRDGGVLFLGSAETIGAHTELFEPIDAHWRIYRSKRVCSVSRFELPQIAVKSPGKATQFVSRRGVQPGDDCLAMAHRALLDQYAPPSVVVNQDFQILVYHGETSRYISQPGGHPTRDLLALVPIGLRSPIRHAVQRVLREDTLTVSESAQLQRDGVRQSLIVTARMIGSPKDHPRKVLISFSEPEPPPVPSSEEYEAGGIGAQTVSQLEDELRQTRSELHELSDHYDRIVEEHSTFNEEMLSVNEELQSANEELETSKEELQSLNEELNTLNNELRSKVYIVEQTNNDLSNLISSTEIATIFLDSDFRIRWFSPAMKSVFQLIPSDVGRPIHDLVSAVNGSDLEHDARNVLNDLTSLETEVTSQDEKTFIRRLMPYRTADHRIDGVVATFFDVTEHKQAERQRERLMHELSHRIKNTLATVQAIAHGLARTCGSLPEFLTALESRLTALARAHAILTMPGEDAVDIQHLLRREVRPYLSDDSDRIRMDGEELTIPRESAIAIELIFHELVTNALKFGALSGDTGSINVQWSTVGIADERRVRIDWIEAGGPVVESPRRAGFGMTLIQNCVRSDLNGKVDMRFDPSGFRCAIEFPTTRGR